MTRELFQDILLILVVAAGLISFFYNPIGGEAIKYLQTLSGGIVGFFLGIKEVPLARSTKLGAKFGLGKK